MSTVYLRVLVGCLLWFALPALAARAQPASYEALNAELQQLYNANRFREMVEKIAPLEAASLVKFGANAPKHAETLQNIGGLYRLLGRFADAERYNLAALEINKQNFGPYGRPVADVINDLGSIYAETQRYAEAEAAFRRSHDIDKRTLPPDDTSILGTIGNLANVLNNQSRYGEAEDILRPALALADKPATKYRHVLAGLLSSLSSAYLNQSRYSEAVPLLTREIDILEKLPRLPENELATALNNLANARTALKDHAVAEQLLIRVLGIDQRLYGADAWQVGVGHLNLGNVQRNLGRTSEAEQSFKRAAEITRSKLGPESTQFANALNNLGDLYQRTGRAAEAVGYLERAFAIYEAKLGPLAADVVRNLNGQTRTQSSLGNETKALALARDAARRVIERSRAVASARDRGAAASPLVQQRFAIDDLLVKLAAAARTRAGEETALGREAFELAQWPAQSLAGNAIQQMATRFAQGTSPLAVAVREAQDLDGRWIAAEARFKAALGKAGGGQNATELAAIRAELAQIEERQAAIAARLAKEFPDYAALARPAPLPIEAVQRLLAADEAMLVVYSAPSETYVWAVGANAFAWHTVALPRGDLAQKIAALRSGLEADPEKPGQPLFAPAAAYELFKLLLEPVDGVAGKARHLMVVASGPLTSLPLHVLVTSPPAAGVDYKSDIGRYRDVAWLAARQATSVLPTVASLGALRRLASAPSAPEPLIGFGDPVFRQQAVLASATRASGGGAPSRQSETPRKEAQATASAGAGGSAGATSRQRSARASAGSVQRYFRGIDRNTAELSRLAPLPETADELRAVAERVGAPPASLWLGPNATEAAVKTTDLTRYRVVYFATHGLVAGELQGFGEPSLVLTLPPQPSPDDDGLLTASEIATLKLRADWVVLSACNTAAGGEQGADAMSGLARAFFYAGAKALLVTHWEVNSLAAVGLTTGTFASLATTPKEGRAQALRDAMLALMRSDSDAYNAYPGTWAPFVVVGEGRR